MTDFLTSEWFAEINAALASRKLDATDTWRVVLSWEDGPAQLPHAVTFSATSGDLAVDHGDHLEGANRYLRELTLRGARADHLEAVIEKLREAGADISHNGDWIRVRNDRRLKAVNARTQIGRASCRERV